MSPLILFFIYIIISFLTLYLALVQINLENPNNDSLNRYIYQSIATLFSFVPLLHIVVLIWAFKAYMSSRNKGFFCVLGLHNWKTSRTSKTCTNCLRCRSKNHISISKVLFIIIIIVAFSILMFSGH